MLTISDDLDINLMLKRLVGGIRRQGFHRELCLTLAQTHQTQEAVAETLQCGVVDWAAMNHDAHSPPDPSNEQLQRECALGRTTDTKDPMHGKRLFPWPQQHQSSRSIKTQSSASSASPGASRPRSQHPSMPRIGAWEFD